MCKIKVSRMVSAPSIETAPKFAHILHQCENLKASIHGKSLEVTSILMDEFVFRQNLENLYKRILLSDVQFALDNKIELELWNNAFKEHIDSFRYIIKERKGNNEKNEFQAKLFMFLDASIGFYFQLLQEFCDRYDLDLPYHGKARQLGILTKPKKFPAEKKPKLDSCLYICQDCLVHLGDLARYRNEIQQAHAFYLLAAKILPGNGQPYNQLAILASAKNDLLYSVFYYCKSISVPNPFPAAASNLQKTFSQASAKYSYNVLGKSSGLTIDEFLGLFINLSGCTYLKQDFSKLNVLRNKVLQDFNKMLMDIKSHQLILITGICIFSLQKSRSKTNMTSYVAEDETNVWNFMLSFCISILQLYIENTIELLQSTNASSNDLKCLPGIKMFTDWILCNTIGLLADEYFQTNVELFNIFAVFGNVLQKVFKQRDKSLLPLMEDWELHGISALQKVHRRYDFRIQPLDMSEEKLCNIRVTRILRFLDWLTKQVQTAKLITKKETENVSEYVCLMSLKQQGGRCKSPFSEKSMSLFRTDSEECGMNDIPSVHGPVASYSLFDTMWKSTLQQTPSETASLVTTSSPLIPLKGVTIVENSSCISDIHEQNGLIGTTIPATSHMGTKQQQPPNNSPVFEELTAKHNNLQKKPQYSKVVSSSNGDTALFSKTVVGSPHQLQPGSPLQLQSSTSSSTSHVHLPEQQNGLKGNVPVSTEDIPPHPIGNTSHHPLPVQNQLLHAQSFQNRAMKMNQQLNQQQQRHQEILLAGSIFLAKQLESNRVPDNQFHPALIPTASLDPKQSAPAQFATHSPNFGVIGQSMRAPPGMPRSPLIPSQFGPLPPGASNILPANAHHPWVSPNQRLPTNMMVENRSIWSSNYAIGQGELSPLEQLLQEQRRHQRPK